MKVFKLILPCLILTTLFGCASPAETRNMQVNDVTGMHFDNALKDEIKVEQVAGGHQTNPLWKSNIGDDEFKVALQNSLKNAGLLYNNSLNNQSAKYELSVIFLSVDQPYFGVDFTVKTAIKYLLKDKQTGKIIFEDNVIVPYTAKFNDAWIAVKRLRLANEGAAKANITKLLNNLENLKIEKSSVDLVVH